MYSRTCIRTLLSSHPAWTLPSAVARVFIRRIHHELKSDIKSDVSLSTELPSLDPLTTPHEPQSESKISSKRGIDPIPLWLAQKMYENRARPKKSLFPELASCENWSFQRQRTSSKKSVAMKYTASASTADWLISTLKGDVFGMDIEWKAFATVDVSLVQLCDEDTVLLIHTAPMEGMFLGKVV